MRERERESASDASDQKLFFSLSLSSLRALEVENTTYSLSVVGVSQKQLINEIEVGLWPFTTRHL